VDPYLCDKFSAEKKSPNEGQKNWQVRQPLNQFGMLEID
jgi:hypothetical protein